MYTNDIPLSEQWVYWEPIGGLQDKFYIDYIQYSDEKIIITLSSNHNTVTMTIKPPIVHYNRTNESFCIALFMALSQVNFGKRTFFKVNNSSYLKKLHSTIDQSLMPSLNHFCLISGDEVIHIIVPHEPEIKLIK